MRLELISCATQTRRARLFQSFVGLNRSLNWHLQAPFYVLQFGSGRLEFFHAMG
jgi:hypothetical protein